jgi:uroporphyrinogen-III synthase
MAAGEIGGGDAPSPAAREGDATSARRSLRGLRVLVTRARARSAEMLEALRALGADPVELPLTEIVPPEDPRPLDEALGRLGSYDWVIFTSANAARAVTDHLEAAGLGCEAFGRARVCAIGPASAAALEARGVRVDLVPAEHAGEGVVEALEGCGSLAGRRVLFPRAEQARAIVPEGLRRLGAEVDDVVAYRAVRSMADGAAVLERLRHREIEIVTLASPSAVRALVALCGGDAEAAAALAGATVAVLGPSTRAAALHHGLRVDVMPEEYTVPALLEALGRHVRERGDGSDAPLAKGGS